MGHAHHFLSRLDRVSLPHVEVALDLYNDVPLLRFILDTARIPERVARVALSLDHPEEGPFLVVTREGRFVTCLGAGMSAGDLPVITRGQLDGIAAKAGVLRSRMDAALRLAGPMGGVGKLLRRIHEAGDDLSREEIVAIAGLQPLYAFELFWCLFAASQDVIEARKVLIPHLRRSDKLYPHFRGALRSYWNTLWSIGHFSVLCTLDGWAGVERWPEEARGLMAVAPLAWAGVREGLGPLALRGLWAVGRVGKRMLPDYKQRYREAGSPLALVAAGGALAAIGLRHAGTTAEVVKALRVPPPAAEEEGPLGELLRLVHDPLVAVVAPEEGSPQDFVALHRKLGAGRCLALAKLVPPGSPLHFTREEDVPDELALPSAVNDPFDFMSDPRLCVALFALLPWVARAAPEQLYLPREAIRAGQIPWAPEHSVAHLRQHRDYYGNQNARRRPAGPARKGPCPCGSGKKYKRCCGEAEGEGEAEEG
jgi:hypothetical protein